MNLEQILKYILKILPKKLKPPESLRGLFYCQIMGLSLTPTKKYTKLLDTGIYQGFTIALKPIKSRSRDTLSTLSWLLKIPICKKDSPLIVLLKASG